MRIRSIWSSGSSRKIELALVCCNASTIIKSRRRSRKSAVKRRGSWPDSITRSTVLNSEAPSRAASASMASSRSAPSVKPRSWIAISYETPSLPAPANSWPRIESASRTEPPDARTTNGNTPLATFTPSALQIFSRCATRIPGGTKRNG